MFLKTACTHLFSTLFLLSGFSCAEKGKETAQSMLENRPVVPFQESAVVSDEGIGRFSQVVLNPEIDVKKAAAGKLIFENSCKACHRLTEDVINGPGLKNVTNKYKPAWILNLLTNTTQMLREDPTLAAKTEIFQTRMPDLQLPDDAAFKLLEYLRQNDADHIKE
jgi:mono/diheme cytochrome c family protein